MDIGCDTSGLTNATPANSSEAYTDSRRVFIGYLITVLTIGIVGNTISCIVFKFKMKSNTGNTLILCLDMFNLFNCLTDIPYQVYLQLSPCVEYMPVVCKVMHYILYASIFASIFTLLLIATDKYYKICKPLRLFPFKRTDRLIMAIVAAGVILAVPVTFLSGPISSDHGDIGCSLTYKPLTENTFRLLYFIGGGCITLGVFVCMSVLYGLIISKVRSISRSRPSFRSPSEPTLASSRSLHRVNRQTVSTRDFAQLSELFAREMSRTPLFRQKRTTVICVSMSVVFLVCFFPTVILVALREVIHVRKLSPVGKMFYQIFLRSYFLSDAVNPIVYGFLNPLFRRECLGLLKDISSGQICKTRDRDKIQLPMIVINDIDGIKCEPPTPKLRMNDEFA